MRSFLQKITARRPNTGGGGAVVPLLLAAAAVIALAFTGCEPATPADFLRDHIAVVTVKSVVARQHAAVTENGVNVGPDTAQISLMLDNTRKIPLRLELNRPNPDDGRINWTFEQISAEEVLVTINGFALGDGEQNLILFMGADGRDFQPFKCTLRCTTVIGTTPYTVTFIDNDHGTATPAQTVYGGSLLGYPDQVSAPDGYYVAGWYRDSACSDGMRWDFAKGIVTGDITLYAKWADVSTALTYTVTFDTQGKGTATSPPQQTVYDGSLATEPPAPTETGWAFAGWFTDSTCTGTNWNFSTALDGTNTQGGALVLYAKWTEAFTVTFNNNGKGTAPAQQPVPQGGKASDPGALSEPGWSFVGWYETTPTALWTFAADAVTGNITLNAKWTEGHTVTFNTNGKGTQPLPQIVYDGGKATDPGTLSDPSGHFTFADWYKDDGTFSTPWNFAADTVTGHTTIIAKWTPDTHTVTFHYNGNGSGIPTLSLTHGDTIPAASLPSPTEAGYTFDDWYKDASFTNRWYTAADTVTGDIDLYANWTAITYTVTFDKNGHGTAPYAQTVPSTTTRFTEPPAPTATGYTFGGWYKEDGCTNVWTFATEPVTGSITLWAKWTAATYTVTFNANGHGTAPAALTAVPHGTPITDPGTLSEAGWRFDGWYESNPSTTWNFTSDTVTADITLYAKWTQPNYNVTFDNDGKGGTAPVSQNVSHGGYVPYPGVLSEPGYTFGGWYKSGLTTAWNFGSDTVTGNITLYAKWTANTYTVTFNTNGHGTATPATLPAVSHGTTISAPTTSTVPGYTFGGAWYKSDLVTVWNFGSDTVTTDMILYAKWTPVAPVPHTVNFSLNGRPGTPPGQQDIADGGKAASPGRPSAAGWTFDDWYTAGTGGSIWNFSSDTVTADMTLYAHWTQDIYSVTYHLGDYSGSAPAALPAVPHGTKISAPTAPNEMGWTFDGWYTDSTYYYHRWDFTNDTVVANIDLYAKRTHTNYAVSFSLNGRPGTPPLSQTIAHNGTVTEPTAPTAAGYDFDKWCKSDLTTPWTFGTSGDTVTGPVTIYAKWISHDEQDFGAGAPITDTQSYSSGGGSLYTYLDTIKASGNNYVINLSGGQTHFFNGTIPLSNGTKVSLRGGSADRIVFTSSSYQGSLFTTEGTSAAPYATLILRGPTLEGNAGNTDAVVHVYPLGSFILRSGIISGNSNSGNGGGVFVDGIFTMYGGTISSNSAARGGGVYFSAGNFTMEGGTIAGNFATATSGTDAGGGGVYISNGGGGGVNLKGGTITGTGAPNPNIVNGYGKAVLHWNNPTRKYRNTTVGPGGFPFYSNTNLDPDTTGFWQH